MKNHLIPQRRSLAKTIAIGLLILAQVIAPIAHAETITYQHDNNGNITQRGTTTYIYDALNRLTSESGPAKTQSITYDANGNRLSDGAGTYTYALGSNRMLTRRGLAVTTDALGNITADGTGREYVFNQARQLAQVKQGGILIATYTYDHAGLRISKVTTASAPQGAQTVISEYDEQGHLIAEFSGTGAPIRAYIWLGDTPLSQIEYVPSRKIYYFNVDHLNTPRSLMDDTGKTVWRWESDAFGSTLPNEDPDGDGVKMTSNLRFPGQYYDKETGLHYNWHRYYDPSMGQYIQADPIGLAGGINLYTYVNNNPLSYIDPTGLKGRGKTPSRTGGQFSGQKQLLEDLSDALSPPNLNFGDPFIYGPKKDPKPTYCQLVCPNDGNQCTKPPEGGVPSLNNPGCYEVCTFSPVAQVPR